MCIARVNAAASPYSIWRQKKIRGVVVRREELRVVTPLAHREHGAEGGILAEPDEHLVAKRLRVGDVFDHEEPDDPGCPSTGKWESTSSFIRERT